MNLVPPSEGFAVRASMAVFLAAALGGCAAEEGVGSAAGPVVYSVDDRVEVFESTSALFEGVARDSIVAMVPANANLLVANLDGTFTPDPFTLAQYIAALADQDATLPDGQTLCPDARFAAEPTIAACSGTLIDDDLVLTAGHCTDGLTCPSAQFVFDYFYSAAEVLETIETNDVYGCAEVLVQRLDPNNTGQDYAIIRLDRPVVGRSPAPVDLGFGVASGDPVVVIGYPTGLPAKIDDGGVVIDDRAASRDYFTATTDTFGGNSGSGVFDASGTLVGVLVRGETDYVSNGSCIDVNVIDVGSNFSAGEEITYATNAIEALCDVVANGETSLCADGAPIGGAGGGTGGGAMPGGGAGGGTGGASDGGDCAASPGGSSPAGLVSMLVVAALIARRRRGR